MRLRSSGLSLAQIAGQLDLPHGTVAHRIYGSRVRQTARLRAERPGLIHADGCRSVNRATTRGKQYAYPRYLFANESVDILGICGAALDPVGARWRINRRNSISVAIRADVALLDEFIGPDT